MSSAPDQPLTEAQANIVAEMSGKPKTHVDNAAECNKLASLTDPVFDGPRGCPKGPTGPAGHAEPSIALVTMTKNRPEKLAALVESVKGFVDRLVILDTGSDEKTLHFLKTNWFYPLWVDVFSEPFVNFEVSRNRLMELAKDKADWLLLLDDDMGLDFQIPENDVKKLLDSRVGAYMIKHADNPSYWVARLVRGDRLWRYKGVTHEYLEGGGVGNPKLLGCTIWHKFNHGPEKFGRDLRLLTADIARDPNDVRTIFYLANTLRDLGQIEAAIRFYCMRANMGGWEEEVWNSMYEAARLAKDPEGMKKAHEYRPIRAEAAAWLSGYYKFAKPDLEQHKFWESVRAAIPLPTSEYLFLIPFCYGPDFVSRLENYK